MAFFDKSSLNANSSKWWAIANIIAFIFGALLPLIFGHANLYDFKFFVSEIVLVYGTCFATEIGFRNTFATNDTWKTVVQVASSFLDIFVPALFIGATYNG